MDVNLLGDPLDFQRRPMPGMTPYTEGFFAGRRWGYQEVKRFMTEMAADLDKNNPSMAALLRGCWDDLEKKL
jgi:hypothetical protein